MPADGWDQPNQPGAFARPPQQPVEQRGTLGDAVSAMAGHQPQQAPRQDYVIYELPRSVTESTEWRGSEADLTFGLREPTSEELRRLFKGDNQDDAIVVPNFIAQIGDMPVTDYTVARAWWGRLSPKAQNLVSQLLLETFMPTPEEGNALRASRRRPGQARTSG